MMELLQKQVWQQRVDKLVYVAGFVGIIFTIPQIMQIWVAKDATGVSAITWFIYVLIALVWIVYGSVNEKRSIVITYGFYVLVYSMILLGAFLY